MSSTDSLFPTLGPTDNPFPTDDPTSIAPVESDDNDSSAGTVIAVVVVLFSVAFLACCCAVCRRRAVEEEMQKDAVRLEQGPNGVSPSYVGPTGVPHGIIDPVTGQIGADIPPVVSGGNSVTNIPFPASSTGGVITYNSSQTQTNVSPGTIDPVTGQISTSVQPVISGGVPVTNMPLSAPIGGGINADTVSEAPGLSARNVSYSEFPVRTVGTSGADLPPPYTESNGPIGTVHPVTGQIRIATAPATPGVESTIDAHPTTDTDVSHAHKDQAKL
eukprot:Clim_evm81s77 gene=Clim_evmTU81s77